MHSTETDTCNRITTPRASSKLPRLLSVQDILCLILGKPLQLYRAGLLPSPRTLAKLPSKLVVPQLIVNKTFFEEEKSHMRYF